MIFLSSCTLSTSAKRTFARLDLPVLDTSALFALSSEQLKNADYLVSAQPGEFDVICNYLRTTLGDEAKIVLADNFRPPAREPLATGCVETPHVVALEVGPDELFNVSWHAQINYKDSNYFKAADLLCALDNKGVLKVSRWVNGRPENKHFIEEFHGPNHLVIPCCSDDVDLVLEWGQEQGVKVSVLRF